MQLRSLMSLRDKRRGRRQATNITGFIACSLSVTYLFFTSLRA